jgi:hypothetical protein
MAPEPEVSKHYHLIIITKFYFRLKECVVSYIVPAIIFKCRLCEMGYGFG